MRVLITYGTRRGGTEGIAQILGKAFESNGVDVELEPVSRVRDLSAFDAAIIGGALYANRWHGGARRFVARNVAALRRMPTWLFSSGPLDESADLTEIPPAAEVSVLMERIGARGHRTFGGRLSADAKGFAASALSKERSGDFRNPERIRAWAAELVHALPQATPGSALDHPARSPQRLLAHGCVGWAASTTVMAGSLQLTSATLAVVLHGIAAPCIFTAVSLHYFRQRGARDPLSTAVAFVLLVALLDLAVVAGLVMRSLSMFANPATWLPLLLIFFATWATGSIMATLPVTTPALGSGPFPVQGHLRKESGHA